MKSIICPVFDKQLQEQFKKIREAFTEEAARADGQVRDVKMNNFA